MASSARIAGPTRPMREICGRGMAGRVVINRALRGIVLRTGLRESAVFSRQPGRQRPSAVDGNERWLLVSTRAFDTGIAMRVAQSLRMRFDTTDKVTAGQAWV